MLDEKTPENLEEQFYHEVNGREYFCIPSLLPLMADNVFGDGTFLNIENIANAWKLYSLNVYVYSDDRRKTHCQPILAVLLPDDTNTTYSVMWNDIKQLYRTYVGEELNPTVVHSDNEESFIQATKSVFPATRIATGFF